MISISMDEGAVFDILAINIVKQNRNPSDNLNRIINNMKTEIINQIGIQKTNKILSSEEFKELIQINNAVFDLIDQAQNGNGFAREVQDGNHKRYTQKVILQKTFFYNHITEEKM